MYYYTAINGSKPIKDPRIGTHFGSQRHKFKSIQKLEQETATHGISIYSVDGREWIRQVGYGFYNNSNGNFLNLGDATYYYEITAYCSGINLINLTRATATFRYTVDGGTEVGTDYGANSLTSYLLGSRFVDAGSVSNLTSGLTLGIHTIKIRRSGTYGEVYGIELIAQDTTSATTKSQIQIPSQNVVSYGKKFTVADTPHYNPFAFKTDGTTAWASGAHNGTAWPVGTGSSANIDTATSLGLAAWVSTNYYKPYNGGRVVWWVDSSGTLKCSVNMMPPNARSVANSASLTNGTEKGDDSAGTSSAAVANNTSYPTFTDQAIDHSQAEVAKTFHWREFGNGSANGGTGATYADASMLTTTADDIAYVMDDGLTSMAGDDSAVNSSHQTLMGDGNDDTVYITFIGTGVSVVGQEYLTSWRHLAQNLPYGTHILKTKRKTATDLSVYTLDGIEIYESSGAEYGEMWEVSFHQPKMPPIPEDAVVIADYMLMADHVVKSAGLGNISKGVRSLAATRDFFYDATGVTYRARSYSTEHATSGIPIATNTMTSGQSSTVTLPYFGTDFVITHYANRIGTITEGLNSDVGTSANLSTTTNAGATKHTGNNLAVNQFKCVMVDGQGDDELWISTLEVASPIHTSSHYQTFETPFLHELVGGDRNMEQTNLVVTSDGKTWDEVTRDVSYIGNNKIHLQRDGGNVSSAKIVWDVTRGSDAGDANSGNQYYYNKDFALAYDRLICLKDGQYEITGLFNENGGGAGGVALNIGGTRVLRIYDDNWERPILWNGFLKRGESVDIEVTSGTFRFTDDNEYATGLMIKRI
jgi:hypothetical protein